MGALVKTTSTSSRAPCHSARIRCVPAVGRKESAGASSMVQRMSVARSKGDASGRGDLVGEGATGVDEEVAPWTGETMPKDGPAATRCSRARTQPATSRGYTVSTWPPIAWCQSQVSVGSVPAEIARACAWDTRVRDAIPRRGTRGRRDRRRARGSGRGAEARGERDEGGAHERGRPVHRHHAIRRRAVEVAGPRGDRVVARHAERQVVRVGPCCPSSVRRKRQLASAPGCRTWAARVGVREHVEHEVGNLGRKTRATARVFLNNGVPPAAPRSSRREARPGAPRCRRPRRPRPESIRRTSASPTASPGP